MLEAAEKYARDIAMAQSMAVQAEPEAQLTSPVQVFLTEYARKLGIGELSLIREAQLDGVRPDFAAVINGRPCGWIELKAPSHNVDGPSWRGREKNQWALLSELDALIVTNGTTARLYQRGEAVGPDALLPADDAQNWDPEPLGKLLRLFVESRPATVTRVSQLADRLAPLTRMLRDRIEAGLKAPTAVAPIRDAKNAWSAHVHEGVTDVAFASDLAQVIAYSLAIASLRGGADKNGDRFISLKEARDSLRGPNAVLAAALGPALEVKGLQAALAPEIGAIERLASVVDGAAVARSKDSRGEPWLWFYEDFLNKYDREAQKKAGVYYTPTEVVQTQVRLVDHVLRHKFRKRLSFGDKSVVTLDPATGSGTYPLAVLDKAAEVATKVRGHAGPQQIAKSLSDNLIAFELLPGPYAVAHLRIGQRLAELAGTLTPPQHVRVYLTDTLEDPTSTVPALNLWGDVDVLAKERARAAEVKNTQPVTAIIGNPPYARKDAESSGGWVLHPHTGRAIFDDVTDAATRHGVIFSAMRSVYDDYAYFWRWALWKAFEQDPTAPAVVSFITSSTWLQGPGFVGLRELARNLADEIWIVDLGGAGRGAVKDENVFAINTAVAIVTLFRTGKSKVHPATVTYQRIVGSRSEKLNALASVEAPDGASGAWHTVEAKAYEPLLPASADTWTAMPALTDIFPWQQPGSVLSRAWPVAPEESVLERRWTELLKSPDATERAAKFATAKTGRNIHTSVAGLPKLSELPPGAPHPPIVRYGYRSFDRQWTFEDPRVAKTESPSLWNSRSSSQIYLTSILTGELGDGPALTVTTAVPDFHHFCNRGGKDVIPLYRDGEARNANVTAGVLELLNQKYGCTVSPEDLVAYVYAVLAHPGYRNVFAEELKRPGLRVPLTAEPALFKEGVEIGKHLLWLQTYAERYQPSSGEEDLPDVPGLEWAAAISTIPESPAAITYDASTLSLHIGDGRVSGVSPDVWDFEVSGFPVLRRWLASRTRVGSGRAANPKHAKPLDYIRPTTWADAWNDELLDLIRVLTHTIDGYPRQAKLLDAILGSSLLTADELPTPAAIERKVPK